MKHLDKIKGGIFGIAFGDALGVGAEFMTRNEIKSYYPEGLHRFDQIIRDAHRCQWEPGEWTNDTDMTIVVLESVLRAGKVDIYDMAASMKKYVMNKEFDVTPLLRRVITTEGWERHPVSVTHKVWEKYKDLEATNEATLRAIVAGITSKSDEVMENTRQMTLITNDDNRCVSTAMILAKTAHSLLWDEKLPEFEELVDICEHIDPRTLPWLETVRDCSIEDLDLDDEDTLAYTRKAMCSALWALWHTDSAEEGIKAVIMQGGDADSNAAVAGALCGLKYGYDALPAEKEKLVNFKMLEELAERVTEFVENQGR